MCKRPLYNAIRKYGAQNFAISLLEEVEDEYVDERERFWIQHLRTYGVYNATKGGEGYNQLDTDKILSLYQELGAVSAVRKETGHTAKAISQCLRKAGIEVESAQEKNKRSCSKSLCAFDRMGRCYSFHSRMDAARWIAEVTGSHSNPRSIVAHICDAANGKYKSAYGYTWADCSDKQ